MSIIKSISISEEFDGLSKEYKQSWSEAARIGMSILLAEIGVREYDNNLNIMRRMTLMRKSLEEKSEELEKLKSKIDPIKEAEEEFENVIETNKIIKAPEVERFEIKGVENGKEH